MINTDPSPNGIVVQSTPRTSELAVGTQLEIVNRRATQMILGPSTPEQPESGNGVATVPDLAQAIAPFMAAATGSLQQDRVRHWLVVLEQRGLLAICPDGYYVQIAGKETP